MLRRRFLSITRFLHFVDNEMNSKEDRIRKVRSVIDYLNTRFQELRSGRKCRHRRIPNEIQRAAELCTIYSIQTSEIWNQILQIM